ncbi:hypothetical protein Tco_0300927 [Tanacetum coccineum]
MSVITDVKCVLSQKAFDDFCEKFHIPEEVHHVLPNQGDTMHERPAGKIGYTLSFLTLPTLGCLCLPFLIIYLGTSASTYHNYLFLKSYVVFMGLHRPLGYSVDNFACPARFSWHTAKNVTRDPAPAAADFNAQDYATLVAHPSPFRKFPEEFLCLVGLSRHYTLDEETYPSFLDKDGEGDCLLLYGYLCFHSHFGPHKVKIVERERIEGEPLLLETTVSRIVPLLPVAPNRGESQLEASVDKLFDEGGSGTQAEQGDSAGGGGGQGVNIQPFIEVPDAATEDVALAQPRRQKKRKTLVADAGGPSHPPKKLREDHRTPSEPFVAGKSRSAVQRLLAGAVLNAEVRGEPIPTLPFVTSSVSATPEREGEDHTDFVTRINLRTIRASQRFVISSDSSHHSGANATEAEVNSLVRSTLPQMTTVTTVIPPVDSAVVTKEKTVKPSLFGADSSSAGRTNPTSGGFSNRTGSDFLVGGIRTVIDPDSDLQKVYIPQWNVTNRSRLDDGGVCREMVNEFAPPNAEVRMRAEYNIRENRRLKSVVEEKDELLKTRDEEIENLKAHMSFKEVEAVEAIRLRAEASKFETVDKCLRDEVNALVERNTILEKEQNALDVKVADLETSVICKERELTDSNAQLTSVKSQNDNLIDHVHELQDAQLKVVNDKFDKLYANFVEMDLHLEEKFYPHLLTTIFCRRWLLTHGMELAIAKCLNSPEYLSALEAAIGKAIEKGMQDGLSVGITHGKEGRVLTDVAAYYPSAEVDYVSALQQLQNVNFSLLAKLKTNKDASVKILMNILRLEETLAERLGLNKTVIGASALSLALGVSDARVWKIRENIASHRSVLQDVFVHLVEPFSAAVVTSTEGTSNVVPATTGTTAALSITIASASTVTPISVDDYEVTGTDDQAAANENVADGNANPFPNVDDADLNIPQ